MTTCDVFAMSWERCCKERKKSSSEHNNTFLACSSIRTAIVNADSQLTVPCRPRLGCRVVVYGRERKKRRLRHKLAASSRAGWRQRRRVSHRGREAPRRSGEAAFARAAIPTNAAPTSRCSSGTGAGSSTRGCASVPPCTWCQRRRPPGLVAARIQGRPPPSTGNHGGSGPRLDPNAGACMGELREAPMCGRLVQREQVQHFGVRALERRGVGLEPAFRNHTVGELPATLPPKGCLQKHTWAGVKPRCRPAECPTLGGRGLPP